MKALCNAHRKIKADGLCPICLINERDELRLENERLRAELDRKNDLLAYVDKQMDNFLMEAKMRAIERRIRIEELRRMEGERENV